MTTENHEEVLCREGENQIVRTSCEEKGKSTDNRMALNLNPLTLSAKRGCLLQVILPASAAPSTWVVALACEEST